MLIYLQLIDDPEEQSRFERLYTTYRSLMFHKANEILGNTQDAEDAVHEAFLAIAKNFDRVSTSDHRETASFTVKIVTNKAIDIYRRKKKHPTTEYTDALSGETVELEADDDIARVLLKLPVRYRNFILLKYEKEHGGYVVWVLGPACSFDVTAREIMSRLIAEGYCQALLAGNALATHDLEGAYLGTALGCDIRNQKLHYMGHYNHLETINAINTYGSIPAFIQGEGIDNGMKLGCNHPMGPLELGDFIGLDICLAIMDVLFEETHDNKYAASPLLRKMVRGKRLGVKTGIGFYDYSNGPRNKVPTDKK